jgi:hypothetical protein
MIDEVMNTPRPVRCKAKYPFVYEVEGAGQFPDDMLRYDQADVIGWRLDDVTGQAIFKLRSERWPTEGRWRSFLWVVGTGRTDLMPPTKQR